MKTSFAAICLWFAQVGAASAADAVDFRWDSLGLRTGLSATPINQEFVQPEVFAVADLPGRWELGADWFLQPRLDLSAGVLQWQSNAGFIGAMGPVAVLGRHGFPVTFGCGLSPTFLSRHDFGVRNFGFPIQFTSYISFAWEFHPGWRFGYRFQHMSNGSLSSRNPGLNLHNVGIARTF